MNQISTIQTEKTGDDQYQPAGMTMDELESLIGIQIEDGLAWIYSSDDVAASIERNYDYYRGIMGDLPETKDRSKVTDRTVSTYINLMLPSLLRVFTAGKTIAAYEPTGMEDERLAALITRYVNDIVFKKDNRGEVVLYQWAFDALVQKVGLLVAYFEECWEDEDKTFKGLDENMLAMAYMQAMQSGAEIVAATGEDVNGAKSFSITVRKKVNKSRVRIENVPFEEFCISRDARTLEDAILVSHRRNRSVGDLLKEGYAQEDLDELGDADDPRVRTATQRDQQQVDKQTGAKVDPALRQVTIHQGIVRCDFDGEGIKEWFFVAGKSSASVKVLKFVPYDYQIVFADFCPNPLPHVFWGRCPADDLAEIQKVNTVLLRQLLDNLYLSNTPQREVVQDWIIQPDQLMNMAPGSSVLVKQPGAIREISIPFTAQASLTALEYFDQAAEARTGVGKQAMGLQPDALNNQSATAAQLAYTASLGKVEMIARLWAQGGMRKLFRGILNILVRYQDFSRVVRMDGRAVEIDPRQWQNFGDMDASVSTGLGTGSRERDMAYLTNVIAEQKQIMSTLGPNNPIVGVRQYVNALTKAAEAAGISNPQMFFNDPGDWQPPPPPPPQPSPDTVVTSQALVQAEQVKAAAMLQKAREDRQSDDMQFMVKTEKDQEFRMYETDVNAALEAQKLQIDAGKLGLDAMKAEADASVSIMEIIKSAGAADKSAEDMTTNDD